MVKEIAKSMGEYKKSAVATPVSYTHLDVYKRQILCKYIYETKILQFNTIIACFSLDLPLF